MKPEIKKKLKVINNHKKKDLVLIRKNAAIKSRQWWNNKIKKFKSLLPKYLPFNKIKLFQTSLFTLLITNNKEIQDLNKKYRNSLKATDVLSFHLNKIEQIKQKYLGDIVISIQTAKKQASKNKIPLEVELLTLLIHGYLHLLGYDHKYKKDAKVMFSLQNKLLVEMVIYQ